jgi:PAS domain S-box-containing protein
MSQFYAFCVGCLELLGLVSYLMGQPIGSVWKEVLGDVGVFVYTLLPFFFLHFVVIFVRRYEILKSKRVIITIYFAGLFSYTMVLLGLLPRPMLANGEITSSSYVFFVTWMSIFFSIGIAMMYSLVEGFRETAMKSNFLLGGFAVLLLVLPGPFTESIYLAIFHGKQEWYFFSSIIALVLSIYLVFRHRIIINTPYDALKSALVAMNDILIKTGPDFQIELVRGASETLLGYSEPDLIGQNFKDFVDQKELIDNYFNFAQRSKMRESFFDADMICRNGDRLAMNFSFTPVFANEGIVGFVGVGRKITERRLVELSPDAIAVFSEGKIVYVNAAGARLFGAQSVDKLLGKPLIDFIHPEYWGLLIERLQHVTETEKEVPVIEAKCIKLSGSVVDVELKASPFSYKEKLAVQLTIRDVTERNIVEEKYRQSQEIFGLIAENVSDLIAVVDLEGKRLYNNPAYKTVIGDPDQLKGTDSFQEIHPDDREKVKQIFQETVRSGIGQRTEYRFVQNDGSIRYIESQGNVIREKDGKPSRVIVVSRDITERRRIEAEVRRQKENYEILVNSVDGIVWEADAVTLRTTFVSPQAERLLGYKCDEWIKSPTFWGDHVYYEDREWVDKTVQKAIEEKKFVSLEYRMIAADGRLVSFQQNLAVIVDGGKVILLRGVMVDVTEWKKLEEHLRNAQKMESLGTLAGGIAHDFNNILGIILGYVSVLKTAKDDKIKFSQSIDAIVKASQRGASLVRQILTFARKTVAVYHPVNLNPILNDFIKLLSETLPKTIEISLQLEEDLPQINADHIQLNQALLNLCINARDAMPKGGTLSIKTSLVKESQLIGYAPAGREGDYVCITVSDTGEGMDDETKKHIFEPFFTTKEVGKGTGLGLAVVYGIVNSHGGFITLETIPGKGSTFNLHFPVAPFAESSPIEVVGAEQGEEIEGGRETILLVEDDEMMLDYLRIITEAKGYRVMLAKDGLEAIDLYSKHGSEIDLIVMDVGLPKMSGWEVFQKLKTADKNIKIILAGGYFNPGLKAEMTKAGAKYFAQKPYVPEQLLKQIREALDNSKPAIPTT